MRKKFLNVDGILKENKEITYDDLVWLFNKYIDKFGEVPTGKECKCINNLPHERTIKRILEANNVTNNDFLNQFGKVKHVRTESKDYEYFLKRYKDKSAELGHGLTIQELKNNSFGLPSNTWFVKYCPNKNVKTFDDFVRWAGFDSNKLQKDKSDVIRQLIELQRKLGRPIVKTDIKMETVGFSNIVICRIWGSFSECKKELGLMETLPTQPKPFLYYKNIIDDYVESNNIAQKGFITWDEIEKGTHINHKTFVKSFKDNGIEFNQYLGLKHISLNPNSFGCTTILATGEKISSSFEYIFSNYLESMGYHYGTDYKRDVLYRSFLPYDNKSKINCDYVIGNKYIEIAGLISNKDNNWDTIKYRYNTHTCYQNKMLIKRKLLEDNKKDYLFLFPEDFENDTFKELMGRGD